MFRFLVGTGSELMLEFEVSAYRSTRAVVIRSLFFSIILRLRESGRSILVLKKIGLEWLT